MNDLQIHKFLKEIEKESSDEFSQLVNIGCKYYPTSTLLLMRGRAYERIRHFKKIHTGSQWLAFASMIAFVMSAIFLILKWTLPGVVVGTSALLAFVAFGAGILYLKKEYESLGYLEYINLIIQEELNERKMKRQIKK